MKKRKTKQDRGKFKTFWHRFWAGAMDGIVLMPLAYLNLFIWNHAKGVPTSLLLLWHAFQALSSSAYSISLHARFGQTLGKMAFHVKVVDVTDLPITVSQAVRRDIVPLALALFMVAQDCAPVLRGENPLQPTHPHLGWGMVIMLLTGAGWFWAEVLTMLTNRRRRAIHDLIAGTVVIRIPQPPAN
jgi:uncharacterized RDD family membrane protein YckC